MAVRMAVPMTMMSMSITVPPRRTGMFQLVIQLLDALTVSPDNVSDVTYAVEVELELVQLPHDLVEARNLVVGVVNQIPSMVILLHGNHGGLLREVLDAGLDLHHQSVEVP